MAQLAEQLICNQQVIGSSPIIGLSWWHCRRMRKNGGIPEWPKGADCKSVSSAFGGSNPPSPTQKTISYCLTSRDGAVRKLVGLITRRSQVQILLPQLTCPDSSVGRAMDWKSMCRWFDSGSGHFFNAKKDTAVMRSKPHPHTAVFYFQISILYEKTYGNIIKRIIKRNVKRHKFNWIF